MLIIVRGAGDLATGVIVRLYNSGFKILALETENPSAIRRTISFSESIYKGTQVVEGVIGKKVDTIDEIYKCWDNFEIPIAVDPKGKWIKILKPEIVVDAILAKKNLGTNKNMAPLTIGLGPGFEADIDVNVVIETMRGHRLGQIINRGKAKLNTGVPGEINGVSKERVIYAKETGIFKSCKSIGDLIKKNEIIAHINETEVKSEINGVLRGIIPKNYFVKNGLKIADIDPRIEETENCNIISDKGRALGGSVLEVILKYIVEGERKNGNKYFRKNI